MMPNGYWQFLCPCYVRTFTVGSVPSMGRDFYINLFLLLVL